VLGPIIGGLVLLGLAGFGIHYYMKKKQDGEEVKKGQWI